MSDHRIPQMHVHRVSIPARAVHSHGTGDVGCINVALPELPTDSWLTGRG